MRHKFCIDTIYCLGKRGIGYLSWMESSTAVDTTTTTNNSQDNNNTNISYSNSKNNIGDVVGVRTRRSRRGTGREVAGKTMIAIVSGSLVYYHCAYRNSSLLSLLSDVFIVLLCSLAILGLLFRQMNIS